jgi:hypothetical protein
MLSGACDTVDPVDRTTTIEFGNNKLTVGETPRTTTTIAIINPVPTMSLYSRCRAMMSFACRLTRGVIFAR